jgi:hypothetical protein
VSAIELIKKVAALAPQVRRLFEQLFHAMNNRNLAPVPTGRTNWPDFDERLRAIYGVKIAPDSQTVIDEGRCDL